MEEDKLSFHPGLTPACWVTSLSLSFLICKVRIIRESTSKCYCEDKGTNIYKLLRLANNKQCVLSRFGPIQLFATLWTVAH